MESFREMYERCYMQREDKLNQLKVGQFPIFVYHSSELWCFLGTSRRLILGYKKNSNLKTIFTSADLDQFLAGQGEELLQSGEGETPRDKDGLRWHCSKSTQIGSESAGGPKYPWVSYLILYWLKVSTFSFFRWRMAPLLPQDRPWNQFEGTNRQPFCQWQLKVQVTCRDPNGLG